MGYDSESGQVFKETIVKHEREAPWEFMCRDPKGSAPPPRNDHVKRLQYLCMQKLVTNAYSLEAETLENVPHDLAIRIWTAIRRERQESFHVWKAFVRAGFYQPGFQHLLEIRVPRQASLIDIFDKLSSPAGAWMVDLTLSNASTSAAGLKELYRVENLQNLVVQHDRDGHGCDLNAWVVESWANRARDNGAFKHLETLSLVNVPTVTPQMFKSFATFPSLKQIICAGDNEIKKQVTRKKASEIGWIEIKLERTLYGSSSQMTQRTLGRGHVSPRLLRASEVRDLLKCQRKTVLAMARCDVELGKVAAGYAGPSQFRRFQRDTRHVVQESVKDVESRTESRKKRKLNDTKRSGFAAMLEGD